MILVLKQGEKRANDFKILNTVIYKSNYNMESMIFACIIKSNAFCSGFKNFKKSTALLY